MCHHQEEDQGSQEEEAAPRPGRDHHEALPQDRAHQDPGARGGAPLVVLYNHIFYCGDIAPRSHVNVCTTLCFTTNSINKTFIARLSLLQVLRSKKQYLPR